MSTVAIQPESASSGPSAQRHFVREKIQSMILSNELAPGERLGQVQLAKKLGVTQGVVREALLELQFCGLVEAVDNRGMFVGPLNGKSLVDFFELREMHEALAVRLCCQRATRDQLKELAEIAEQAFTLSQNNELRAMASLDRDFHHRLIQLSQNGILQRFEETYRALGKVVRADRDPHVVRREHLAILESISAGNADLAERLVREHIRSARDMVEKRLADNSFEPKWVI